MLPLFWIYTFSFSIFIGGIIGIARFNKINKNFYPFLFLVWIACVNELVSYILIRTHHTTIFNSDLYVLTESLLLILLFRNFQLFKHSGYLFYGLIAFLVIFWLTEEFFIAGPNAINVYFRVSYSFIIVLLSITMINKIIAENKKKIFLNPLFILCAGFIIFFTYKVLVYSFWIYALNSGHKLLLDMFTIMIYINLLTNLIYAIAVLWMPKKLAFTLPS